MGKWVHRLSEINETERTAICANCGPVTVRVMNKTGWRCNKADPDRNRGKNRKPRYRNVAGIKRQEYEKRLAEQNGVCAICGNPPDSKRLAVDHCHNSGAIRGLLCFDCNVGLGFFKDNKKLLRKAIRYLDDPHSNV